MLRARMAGRGTLRYTPAGIPALDFELEHEGETVEGGQKRRIQLALKAKVLGDDLTRRLQALTLGTDVTFKGFLAAARNGRGVIFHVTGIEPD